MVQGLQQHGADAADEHRGVAVHARDRAVRLEPARPGRAVDARRVLRAVRPGDPEEQLLPQSFSYPRHAPSVRSLP